MVCWDSESCSGSDQQQTTEQWPWLLFWCKLGFGKCFGVSSQSIHWAGCHWFLYKIYFSLHITIQLRNGSLLLCRIREYKLQNDIFFWFAVSSWGTHLTEPFHLSSWLQHQTTVEWLMLGSWTASHVVVEGSASMILSVVVSFQWPATEPHLQGTCFLLKASWTTLHCMFASSSWAKCTVDASCLHCFMTHFVLR